jgi:hypothetical protein
LGSAESATGDRSEVASDTNGKRYVVTFRGNEAYLPLHLFNSLLRRGLIVGSDKPAPVPMFERLGGGVHGEVKDPFSFYVREVP